MSIFTVPAKFNYMYLVFTVPDHLPFWGCRIYNSDVWKADIYIFVDELQPSPHTKPSISYNTESRLKNK